MSDALTLSLRSLANHLRDHMDDPALAAVMDEAADRIEALEAQLADNSERYGNEIADRIEALEAALQMSVDDWRERGRRIEALEAEVAGLLPRDPSLAGAGEKGALHWAVERWNVEVANRPLKNVHRRSLDTTWRQVIRFFGGDDEALCGPRHDDLVCDLPSVAQTERIEALEAALRHASGYLADLEYHYYGDKEVMWKPIRAALAPEQNK